MAVDKGELRNLYLTFLEEDIIRELATIIKADNRIAMEKYYNSRLCQEIGKGEYGIEYMDCKYLAIDLIENEPELFRDISEFNQESLRQRDGLCNVHDILNFR